MFVQAEHAGELRCHQRSNHLHRSVAGFPVKTVQLGPTHILPASAQSRQHCARGKAAAKVGPAAAQDAEYAIPAQAVLVNESMSDRTISLITAAAASASMAASEAAVITHHGRPPLDWTAVYYDQGEQGYDESDEGLPLPKLNDDANDLAPFIPADKAAVLCALRLTGVHF